MNNQIVLQAIACFLFIISSAQAAGPQPLLPPDASFAKAAKDEAGWAFSFDLGTKRVNWNNARWSIYEGPLAGDLTKHNGLKVVAISDKPRSDAGVYIALREKDGSWYYHAWAADLTKDTNEGTVRFADFSPAYWCAPSGGAAGHADENGLLDLDQVNAVAIGCVNPMGVGVVSFKIASIELIGEAEASRQADVTVTGEFLDVNGSDLIPAGLFGSFNLGSTTVDGKKVPRTETFRLASDRRVDLTDKMFYGDDTTHITVNTIGERIRPSHRLMRKDWRELYEGFGTKIAEQAKAAKYTTYVEMWNEPYLNWANKNRANFIPRFFDEGKAAEGGPVHILHDGVAAPHLKWTKDFTAPPWLWVEFKDWRRGMGEDGKLRSPVHAIPYHKPMQPTYGGAWEPKFHPPVDLKEGDTYEAEGKKLTVVTPWHIYDDTQFTFWSGQAQLLFYIDPLLALAKPLKDKAGDRVKLIAGWGFRPSEDHWAAFHMLYEPVIDAAHEYIDGVCDHDYGGNPTSMSGNYEAVTAFGVNKYKRWLYGYNTECSSASDPQSYAGAAESSSAAADSIKFRWFTAKVLHALQWVPDKARIFAHFGGGASYWSDTGEGIAASALINLRGKMLRVVTTDDQLLAVASIDGTDPLNPRPVSLPQGEFLTVAIYNPTRTTRQIALTIDPPAGTTLEPLRHQHITTTLQGPKYADAKPQSLQSTVALEPGSMLVQTYKVQGASTAATVHQRQYFAPGRFEQVTPKSPLSAEVVIDEAVLKSPRRAWVRYVADYLAEGEAEIEINGNVIPLPSAATADNAPAIRQLAIDPKLLTPATKLAIRVKSDRAGFHLACASIMVESDTMTPGLSSSDRLPGKN